MVWQLKLHNCVSTYYSFTDLMTPKAADHADVAKKWILEWRQKNMFKSKLKKIKKIFFILHTLKKYNLFKILNFISFL